MFIWELKKEWKKKKNFQKAFFSTYSLPWTIMKNVQIFNKSEKAFWYVYSQFGRNTKTLSCTCDSLQDCDLTKFASCCIGVTTRQVSMPHSECCKWVWEDTRQGPHLTLKVGLGDWLELSRVGLVCWGTPMSCQVARKVNLSKYSEWDVSHKFQYNGKKKYFSKIVSEAFLRSSTCSSHYWS